MILRNPYDAVLSKLNYLYGGHRGASSTKQFKRFWKNISFLWSVRKISIQGGLGGVCQA